VPARVRVLVEALSGSAERRAQAVLRETRQFYIAIDEQRRVLAWNRSAEQLFGRAAADAVGRVLDDLIIPPSYHAAHQAGVEHFRHTGHGRGIDGTVEVNALRADGSLVPVELSIWAERTRRGFVFHALGSDLSERRRHEEVLSLLASTRHGLLHSGTPAQAQQLLCDTVRELAGCEQVHLYVPDVPDPARLLLPEEHGGDPGATVRLPALRLVASSGRGAPTSGDLPMTPDLQRALSGSGSWAADLDGVDGTGPEHLRALGLTSVAVEAVRQHDRLLGVLVLAWTPSGAAAAPVDRQLLALLATEAAVVIERLSLQRRLEAAALTDSLTGLPNRRALWLALEHEVDRARRTGAPVTLAVLDLDRFKAYNDRLGHPAGDALLVRTAKAWMALVRHVDTLARLGGDEFALLLPDTDAGTAARGLHRIVSATPSEVGVTTGLSQLRDGETAQQLVERADAELYRRKRARSGHR
jgi:diguanylate cyclase (GGDEF)-like protein/PAS domain S-box-containing protein